MHSPSSLRKVELCQSSRLVMEKRSGGDLDKLLVRHVSRVSSFEVSDFEQGIVGQ